MFTLLPFPCHVMFILRPNAPSLLGQNSQHWNHAPQIPSTCYAKLQTAVIKTKLDRHGTNDGCTGRAPITSQRSLGTKLNFSKAPSLGAVSQPRGRPRPSEKNESFRLGPGWQGLAPAPKRQVKGADCVTKVEQLEGVSGWNRWPLIFVSRLFNVDLSLRNPGGNCCEKRHAPSLSRRKRLTWVGPTQHAGNPLHYVHPHGLPTQITK